MTSENKETLSTADLQLLKSLRDRGFCVIVWTPEEVADADISELESIVIERGNNFIESSKH